MAEAQPTEAARGGAEGAADSSNTADASYESTVLPRGPLREVDWAALGGLQQTDEQQRATSSNDPAPAPAQPQPGTRQPRVLLGVSGSVAAIKTAEVAALLCAWADVRVVTTDVGRRFVTGQLPPGIGLYGDEAEWRQWQHVGDEVLHIELRRWADALVLAPLSANTLAKAAHGLCDNLLTCVVRAWDWSKPLLVAPAMNTRMWDSPFTAQQLGVLGSLGARIIPPVSKALACGDLRSLSAILTDTMTEERRPVEMIRLPREEQIFEREAVLGRNASSVFPRESAAAAGADAAATKASLGALRFITETELEAIKAERGGRVEDGAVAPSKPLAEVLREAKEAKEEAFQAMWRQMKTGKNRPLDADEAEFIDAIVERDRLRNSSARAEDATAMEAYQIAVREAAERRAASAAAGPRLLPNSEPPAKPAAPAPAAPRRPALAGRAHVC
ncbi:hypothetical protein WJX81_006182 [Elliptochloris bilobata]|uniref:phosphopantothenoylcysteine decarboxylase n=1 Tax=Elliptochloris bilobata TaxID=381761 RepID=A0AAW1RNZ2_9CHLO